MSDLLEISRRSASHRHQGFCRPPRHLRSASPPARPTRRLPKPLSIGPRKCRWEDFIVEDVIVARRAAAEQAA